MCHSSHHTAHLLFIGLCCFASAISLAVPRRPALRVGEFGGFRSPLTSATGLRREAEGSPIRPEPAGRRSKPRDLIKFEALGLWKSFGSFRNASGISHACVSDLHQHQLQDVILTFYIMAFLLCSQIKLSKAFIRRRISENGQGSLPRSLHCNPMQSRHVQNLVLRCSKNLPWETSLPYASAEDDASIIMGTDVVEPIDTEEAPHITILQSDQDVVEVKNEPSVQLTAFKLPMWLLGPSILLVTGIVPTLWLPLSSVFLGPNIAGLLSLVGLDCIFNMGAMLFFLMADACGRPENNTFDLKRQIPTSYRFWNLAASILGFLAPLALLFASRRGTLQPQLPFIPFAVLLGPYLLLLSVQMLTEMLTWHWKSPVWLVAPVVYECYRVLQLMRGLQLAGEISAPGWMVQSLRGLVSWWVLVLGVQLMRVAWFAGLSFAKNSSYGVSDE
ncbi:uncharacterized protein LOC133888735 [Phragmites australis]|uniref:uncharacterized protein LOC133888735 n=1 Tax=Phragmites australis TaxID=29695 RepID=UPI002D79BCC4|nr:uncharacterized protein LOC133888735 [Phragmites australis]